MFSKELIEIKKQQVALLNQEIELLKKEMAEQTEQTPKLIFKAEIKKQLALRNWSYEDLAIYTNYSAGSIKQLLSNNSRELTDRFINEVASVLNIDTENLS